MVPHMAPLRLWLALACCLALAGAAGGAAAAPATLSHLQAPDASRWGSSRQPPRGAESRRLLQQDGSSSGDSSGTDSSSDSSSDDSSSDSSGSPSAALSSSRAANTFVPEGGKGDWESGIDVGIIMIHATLLKSGKIIGWSARNQGLQEYGTAVYDYKTKTYEQLLDNCGISDCKQAFCGAQTTTAWSQLLIFGGHGDDIQWFRSYNHANQTLWSTQMPSGRWYPSVATLPDGRVLVVGGVNDSGKAGYAAEGKTEFNNPTYVVYDPAASEFGEDEEGMREQLEAAFPLNTYPQVAVTLDGGVIVSSGNLLVKYMRSGDRAFEKAFSYPPRPTAPWSYPQTGVGLPLPLEPPYNRMLFFAAGGSSEDRAEYETPASDEAHIIDLSKKEAATWTPMGPMPTARVMGDGVILCDGTILLTNGAATGTAGWRHETTNYEFRDGTSYECKAKCTKAQDYVYEPTIYDPKTGKWSAAGSLAEMVRPRLYHSIALLQPDCRVIVAGSDVTNDRTAEVFSPPYLSKGPRPVITSAPSFVTAGQDVEVAYTSADPVSRVILIRTGAASHSLSWDARALWLALSKTPAKPGTLRLATPASRSVLVPGMYMLVLLSGKGVPSEAQIISFP